MRSFDVQVTSALRAHFRQPDGSSRPGTDWVVLLADRDEEHRILVRSYSDDAVATSVAQQMETVCDFVRTLLRSGWSPNDYRGLPGELVLTTTSARHSR
jgi:hypothetical protein